MIIRKPYKGRLPTYKTLICNLTIRWVTSLLLLNMPKTVGKPKDSLAVPRSPAKERVKCVGCGNEFMLLLSHLERTKSCQHLYDMSAMRQEAATLTKQRKAQRSHERYHSDPKETEKKKAASKESSKEYYKAHSEEKKAASKKLYEDSPEKKREAMAAYYDNHREDINIAMRGHYINSRHGQLNNFVCPICENSFSTQKTMDRHMDTAHSQIPIRIVCEICEKIFSRRDNLSRHMKEVHGEEKRFDCSECCEKFSRDGSLEKHHRRGKHTFKVVCNYCDDSFFFRSDEEAKRKMHQHYTFGKCVPGTKIPVNCRWYCTRCIKLHCVNEKHVSDEKREILLRRRLEEPEANDEVFKPKWRLTDKVEVSDEFWETCLKTWREELRQDREEKERRIQYQREEEEAKNTSFYCKYCKTTCTGFEKKHYGEDRYCKCPGCLVAGYTHECGTHECNKKECKVHECRRKMDNTPFKAFYLKYYWKKEVDNGVWKVDSANYEKYLTQLKNHAKTCETTYCNVCPIDVYWD